MKYSFKECFLLLNILALGITGLYAQQSRENNCFQRFNPNATGQHNINQYLISLLCRLTYPERLGSDLRSDKRRIPVPDNEFETKLKGRIAHWFYDPATMPEEPQFNEEYWKALKASCKSNFTDTEWDTLEDLYYNAINKPKPTIKAPVLSNKGIIKTTVSKTVVETNQIKVVSNQLAIDPPLFKKTADGRIVQMRNFVSKVEQIMPKKQIGVSNCNTIHTNFLNEVRRYKNAVGLYGEMMTAYEAALPRIHYIQTGSRVDPEAVLISTPTYIIVAFRGTDEYLDCYNKPAGCKSDDQTSLANLNKEQMVPSMHSNIPGKIHTGWYLSATTIERDIVSLINSYNGRNKKIWLAGHSKGAGEASIMAGILIKHYNIPVQSVYTFGGVSGVGNEVYADFLNAYFSSGTQHRMQRFEVIHDFVASSDLHLLPGGFKYKTNGSRCYYNGIDRNSLFFFNRAERGPLSHLTEGEVVLSFKLNPCQHIIDNYCRAAYFLLERTGAVTAGLPSIPAWHGDDPKTCTTN